MPPASDTHTGSPRSLSPANVPDVNGPEDQATVAVWKRRYLVLQETMNAQNPSKKKEKSVNSVQVLV